MLSPRLESGYAAARVHRSSRRRRSGGVPARGARAAGGDAGDRIPQRFIAVRP
jgi:hypothetical protein